MHQFNLIVKFNFRIPLILTSPQSEPIQKHASTRSRVRKVLNAMYYAFIYAVSVRLVDLVSSKQSKL